MATWIKTYRGKEYDQVHDCKNSIWACECSICGWHTGQQGVNFKYCPSCGEKMENALCDDVMAKTDVIAMLENIRSEIKGHMEKVKVENSEFWQFVSLGAELYNAAIQERINELKGDKNEAS